MHIRFVIVTAALVVSPLPLRAGEQDYTPLPYLQDYAVGDEVTGAYSPADGYPYEGMTSFAPIHRGYSEDERVAWLEQCQMNQMPESRGSGGLIGGLVGGVAGAIAGNRIFGGSRTAGTIIGGGAGAVAGSAVGRGSDRRRNSAEANRAWAFCEDYLARYEAAYSYPANGYDAYTAQRPYRTASRAIYPRRTEQIIEEWVEEVPPAPPESR